MGTLLSVRKMKLGWGGGRRGAIIRVTDCSVKLSSFLGRGWSVNWSSFHTAGEDPATAEESQGHWCEAMTLLIFKATEAT